jgi:hypothetical protein
MKKYTHKGWFGFCPVYLRNTFTSNPGVMPRYRWLTPVLYLNVWLQEIGIGLCSMVDPEWEPTWKIRLTGEL